MSNQASLEQAKQLKESGQLGAAAEQFGAILQGQPNQPEANFHLAAILAEQGRVREATPYLERAAQNAPEQVEVLGALAQVYGVTGRFDDAADVYEKLIKQLPQGPATVQALLLHGVMRARVGRYGDAAEDFKWVTQIAADFAPGWHNLANVMLKLKNREGAVNAYRKALELEPDKPHSVYGLGRALIWTKEYDEAASVLTRALELAPDRPQILSYQILALRLAGRGNEANALERLDDSVVTVEMAAPTGYGSLADWHKTLRAEIMNHPAYHAAKDAAKGQGSGASFGDIFAEHKTKVFEAFESQMKAAFEIALGALPNAPDHPVLKVRPRDFVLTGTAGAVTGAAITSPHYRPGMWISGTYHCALPAGLGTGGDAEAGWLEFGGTHEDMPPCPDAPRRKVELKEGMLVAAPAYIFRRRLPFSATEPLVFASVDIPAFKLERRIHKGY